MLKVEGIIIDPDPDRRSQLRQACFAVPVLAKIETSGNLDDVLRRLGDEGDLEYTAIFVSQRFTTEEIAQFIKSAKATERGQDSAFVMVLTTDDQDGTLIADGLSKGADSFLFEPFSVDSLTKTASLAMEIKKQRQELRERATVTLLIKDALNHLDIVSERLVRKQEGGPELKYFRELQDKIDNLNERMQSMYLKILPQIIKEQPGPLLNLDQELHSMKSAKMRAQIRLMQKMKDRGKDIGSLDLDLEQQTKSTPWDEINAIPGYTTLVLNLDLYDRPTSDKLVEFLSDKSKNTPSKFEIDLAKTRSFSSYSLAQLISVQSNLQVNSSSIRIKSLSGFAHESFQILKLDKIIKFA